MSDIPDHIAQNYRELIAGDGRSFDELAESMDRHPDGAAVARWARAQAAAERAQVEVDRSHQPVGRSTRSKSTA